MARSLKLAAFFLCSAIAVPIPAATSDRDVTLVGVFGGKAALTIDGGAPKALAVGQSTRDGVKLIEVVAESAVVDVEGVRRRVTLGQSALRAGGGDSPSSALSLYPDSSGHHFANGAINGASVRFLVDTGASMVSIGIADARRAGIHYRRGAPVRTQTASGPVAVWRVRLDNVRVGDITLHGVDGSVHENNLPFVLLGMSFLNRMDMQRDGDRLVLRRRY